MSDQSNRIVQCFEARDRALGAIIGSALGDTIGLYTEFLSKESCKKEYPSGRFTLTEPATPLLSDNHRNRFAPCSWTDDTDQALLIILAYLHTNGTLSAIDFAARLRRWIREGVRSLKRPPLGIGNTVGSVATTRGYEENPAQVAIDAWVKRGRQVAANGSLMRTHPLGVMCVEMSEEEAWRVAAEYSVVTHADPRCVVSCCIEVALIRGMLKREVRGEEDVDAVIERSFVWVKAQPEFSNPKAQYVGVPELSLNESAGLLDHSLFERYVYAKSYGELELDDRRTMGYVYKCLGSAILALRLCMRSDEAPETAFETIITELVMEGGDSDTNAAVAGAVVGAWLGRSKLPSHWTDGIMHKEWLDEKTEAVIKVSGITKERDSQGPYVPTPDTAPDFGMGEMSDKQVADMEKSVLEKLLTKKKEADDERNKKANKGFVGILKSWMK